MLRYAHYAAPPAVNLRGLVHWPVQIVTIIMHIWHSNPVLRKSA